MLSKREKNIFTKATVNEKLKTKKKSPQDINNDED